MMSVKNSVTCPNLEIYFTSAHYANLNDETLTFINLFDLKISHTSVTTSYTAHHNALVKNLTIVNHEWPRKCPRSRGHVRETEEHEEIWICKDDNESNVDLLSWFIWSISIFKYFLDDNDWHILFKSVRNSGSDRFVPNSIYHIYSILRPKSYKIRLIFEYAN